MRHNLLKKKRTKMLQILVTTTWVSKRVRTHPQNLNKEILRPKILQIQRVLITRSQLIRKKRLITQMVRLRKKSPFLMITFW